MQVERFRVQIYGTFVNKCLEAKCSAVSKFAQVLALLQCMLYRLVPNTLANQGEMPPL